MRPKLIYFAERHPRFGPAEFCERWRRHGELGMSLPRWRNLARYAQCDRIALADAPAGERASDGVATVVFRSEEHRRAHIADPDGAITRADEAETFARPVREVAVLTSETALLPHGAGRTRLFAVLRAGEGLESGRFAGAWLEHARRLAAALSRQAETIGYSHNLARADVVTPLDAACVEEISCDDPQVALALLADAARQGAAEGVIRSFEWVATREHVLWPWGET